MSQSLRDERYRDLLATVEIKNNSNAGGFRLTFPWVLGGVLTAALIIIALSAARRFAPEDQLVGRRPSGPLDASSIGAEGHAAIRVP